VPDRVRTPPTPVIPTTTPNRPATTPQTSATPANAPASWAPKSNDTVLFIAVNNSDAHRSTLESDALKARGTNVTVIQDTKVDDTITTRSASGEVATHKLSTPEGAMSFGLTLGLPGEQTKKIADVLQNAGTDAPILRDFAELKSSLIPDTWV